MSLKRRISVPLARFIAPLFKHCLVHDENAMIERHLKLGLVIVIRILGPEIREMITVVIVFLLLGGQKFGCNFRDAVCLGSLR